MPAQVPSFRAADTPAKLAAELAAWASGDRERLQAALDEGNGRTANAFVRRLSDEDLRTLNTAANDIAVFKEMRRRGL